MARDVKHTYDRDSDTVTRTTTYKRLVKRCEANAKKGTGTGMCDLPLDEHGYCDNPRDHLED